VAAALRKAGLQARWRVLGQLRDLYASLNKGHPTIVIIGQPILFRDGKYVGWSHYKVLYAWDPDEGFAFVDPAAAEDEIYSYQTEAEFMEAWKGMGRQFIEAWL
jgi:hypothetical protein